MKILYEDQHMMIVYKEPGLAVQSASVRTMDLESALRSYRVQKGEEPYIGVVHRLDQPVGGILCFAKTSGAAARLSAQVQDGRMKKTYLARTKEASPSRAGEEGRMEDYLLKDSRKNMSFVSKKGVKGAKRASLQYRFISDDTAVIQLETGRHHQIRVQFASRGWGLAGDQKYAGDQQRFPSLLAWRLSLEHPVTGKRMDFQLEDEIVKEMGYLLPDGFGQETEHASC